MRGLLDRHILGLLIAVLACISPEVALPDNSGEGRGFLRIDGVSESSITVTRFRPMSSERVPLGGLTVPDMKALDDLIGSGYWEPTNVRALLLSEGLAYISNKIDVPQDEADAQSSAVSKRKGMWQDQHTLREHGYYAEFIHEKIWNWIRREWINIVTIIGLIVTVYGAIVLNRCYDIVIVGASSVGKTTLMHRIREDPTVFGSGQPQSTRGEDVSIYKVRKNNHTVYKFTLCDIGGQYPGKMIERLTRLRRMFFLRRKVVLIIVLSPFSKDPSANSSQPIDTAHIARQLGWVESAFKGFLQSKSGRRCKGVLVFLNMFDLFCLADDNAEKKKAYERLFAIHLQQLRTVRHDVPCYVGSAYKQWTTREARSWIVRTVSGEAPA